MDLNITSVINVLCFSSIAILLLYYISQKPMISSIKRSFILFTILLLILRLFIPVEFPLQSNVHITKVYPDIYLSFTKTTVSFHGKEYSLTRIAMIFSAMGSTILFIRLLWNYIHTYSVLCKYEPVKCSIVYTIIDKICCELKCKNHFHIVTSPNRTTPYLFGLIKPTIVLPDIQLTEEDWYYILKHEIYHYHHRDLWIRYACELLLVIYWWNPFLYLLRKQIIKFQEFYADKSVTDSLDEICQVNYMQCLVKIAKYSHPLHSGSHIAAFNSKTPLYDRIKLLLHSCEKVSSKRHQKSGTITLSALLLFFTLLCPNLVILEPRGEIPKEIDEKYVTIDSSNGHLVLREDGKYDIYVNNEYFSTVTTVFDETLPIINTEGDVIHEGKRQESQGLISHFVYWFIDRYD